MADKKTTRKKTSAKKIESKEAVEKKEEKREEAREEVIDKINDNIEKEEAKEDKEQPSKLQIKKENRTLLIVVGVLLLITAAFVLYLIFSSSAKTFTYKGVKYTVEPSGKLTFYGTSLPVIINGTKTNYVIYIQNDPRKLDGEVPFNGSLYVRQNLAVNYSHDLACQGFGNVALGNLKNLYNAMGVNFVYDPNATCDSQLRYVYVNIQPGNETSIEQMAPGCYRINVANCEILPAVERYMTETYQAVNNYLNA